LEMICPCSKRTSPAHPAVNSTCFSSMS
jgi:hypothetical protein